MSAGPRKKREKSKEKPARGETPTTSFQKRKKEGERLTQDGEFDLVFDLGEEYSIDWRRGPVIKEKTGSQSRDELLMVSSEKAGWAYSDRSDEGKGTTTLW